MLLQINTKIDNLFYIHGVIMKVTNMTSNSGNTVPNQFIIEGYKHHGSASDLPMCTNRIERFQSYDSVIAEIEYMPEGESITLDRNYWNYSRTTAKYRNQFLNETTKETQAKIDSGEYILTDLNS